MVHIKKKKKNTKLFQTESTVDPCLSAMLVCSADQPEMGAEVSIFQRDLFCWWPIFKGFPGGSDGEESTCSAGGLGLTPGSGRSLGEGKGYPFQSSGLENSMDRGAWGATVHGVAKIGTQLEKPSTS